MDGGSGSSDEDVTSSSDEEGETVRCTACGRGNRAHEMVLCEHCDRGVHIDCRSPPMAAVPEHDFFCAACCTKAGHPDSSDGLLPEAGQVQLVVDKMADDAAAQRWRDTLPPGTPCDALDRTGHWFPARVILVKEPSAAVEEEEDVRRLCVHYDGWSSRTDEWLPSTSDCIQPRNTHMQFNTPKAKRPAPRRSSRSRKRRRQPPSRDAEPDGTPPDNGGDSPPSEPAAAAAAPCPHCPPGSGKQLGHRGRHLESDAAAASPAQPFWGVLQSLMGNAAPPAAVAAAVARRRNPLQPFCLFEK